MSLPSFQTNTLKSRRKALIDGHEYTVRRMGNIERLEVLQIQEDIKGVLDKYPKDVNDEDINKVDMDNINNLALKSAELLIGLFDDGGDQSKSRALVRSLDTDDIMDIVEQIFSQTEEKEEVKVDEKSR